MDFVANKMPVEIIKEEFEVTYFRDVYSGIKGKCYKRSWKEFDKLKILIRSFIVQIIMMSVSINMLLNGEHRSEFGKIRVG